MSCLAFAAAALLLAAPPDATAPNSGWLDCKRVVGCDGRLLGRTVMMHES